uniref:Uncharacterized protein n=1 Tax=Rhizophora mucronata TaxID=61149 RepID=A0A2P2Q6B8_RHIMU
MGIQPMNQSLTMQLNSIIQRPQIGSRLKTKRKREAIRGESRSLPHLNKQSN